MGCSLRRYVDQEIRAPNNQLPPLEDGLALMAIRTEARRHKCARLVRAYGASHPSRPAASMLDVLPGAPAALAKDSQGLIGVYNFKSPRTLVTFM